MTAAAPVALANLVGGAWRQSASGSTFAVADSNDLRRTLARVPAMSPVEVVEVFDAAVAAAGAWAATPMMERATVLTAAAVALRGKVDEIALLVSGESGKTVAEARGEVAKAADFFDYYAALARHSYGELLPDARRGTLAFTQREPVGVVLAITPWNDPILTPARKLAPALVAGNAVVLKPPVEAPGSAIALSAVLHDAGLPAGVLGTVTGRTEEIAGTLLGDRRVDAVSFTGSSASGLAVQQALADRYVRLQIEAGGKNAAVVLADADLDLAVETIVAAAFGQAGQRCTATSRVIVEAPVAESFIATLCDRAGALRVGPGDDPATTMGPLVTDGHRARVLKMIAGAVSAGATVATGGAAPAVPELSDGCYVSPTVLVDVAAGASIWRDEVFGPVVVVRTVADLDAAVDAVNDSDYGLSASVFTASLESAYRFVTAVETGQVAVNLPTTGWDVQFPFGGFGDSGTAPKEQGEDALRFFTRIKTVAIRYDPRRP